MKYLRTKNAFTQQDICQYVMDENSDVEYKISQARDAFQQWKRQPIQDRVTHLKQALDYFEQHRDEIAINITQEMGKPLIQSHNEINTFLERAYFLCDIAESALKQQILPDNPGFHRQIAHEPLGVVFIMAAWNYPLLVAINGVMTALLAGNTVILKHSSLTPSIGQHFEKAFAHLAGIRPILQHVIVDHKTATRIIEQGDIDHIIFTGSVNAGRQIYAKTAHRIIDCQLELGGKDAAYVAEDADLSSAVASIVDGAIYNAGQSCCGIERVYVHASHYQTFIDEAKKILTSYKLGDPKQTDTQLGPLAKPGSSELLSQHITDAIDKGAELICGGHARTIGRAIFFEPTLLSNVNHQMLVMQEENFGPILPVMSVDNDEQAWKLIDDSSYGLTAAIYTTNKQRAMDFSQQVNAGTVFMNRCDYLDPALPWTGVKNSGKGSALSTYGFYSLTRRKAIHFKL